MNSIQNHVNVVGRNMNCAEKVLHLNVHFPEHRSLTLGTVQLNCRPACTHGHSLENAVE